MAEIRHLENWHDVIFFCWGWSDLDNISQTGDKVETRCRIPIWRTFGRIPWHVIPEPPATLQGAATRRIHCHDSRATCHIASAVTWRNQCHDRAKLQGVRIPSAILKIVFRHILFFVFLMEFGLWRAVSFASSLIHLLSWDRTHETAELLPRISKEYSYSIEQFALTPD